MKRTLLALASVATLASASYAPAATAQSADAWNANDWHYNLVIYGYFPEIGGNSKFPARTGGSDLGVDANTIINALKFAAMGTFEATNNHWGFLADVLYMDLGGSKNGTRDVSIDGHPLPVGVTANASLDIKGTILELAGTYRLMTSPSGTLDLVGGARMLNYKQTLGWEFSADLGPDQPSRTGNSDISVTNWDAIIGVKGRVAFGDNHEWFIPYYADVGTGDSDLTWEALAGLGYSFKWGDVVAAWRYIKYDFKSGSAFEDAYFNGPMLGVAFHW
ncbi:MAG: hypothetical protein JSR18_07100 [Proteobacteria bacterium]|nr:hypothetical protein [Pseudomonadota bacterium]